MEKRLEEGKDPYNFVVESELLRSTDASAIYFEGLGRATNHIRLASQRLEDRVATSEPVQDGVVGNSDETCKLATSAMTSWRGAESSTHPCGWQSRERMLPCRGRLPAAKGIRVFQ